LRDYVSAAFSLPGTQKLAMMYLTVGIRDPRSEMLSQYMARYQAQRKVVRVGY